MSGIDFEKLDQYMQRANINAENLRWYDPREEKILELSGLYWFQKEKRYHRFPADPVPAPDEKIMALAECTAGAQLRFRTDSSRIIISSCVTSDTPSTNMGEPGHSGFDLYMGTPGKEVFWSCTHSVPGKKENMEAIFAVETKEMREFRLNFPLYNGVESFYIAFDADAEVLPPTPLAVKSPIVIYGTSITQGGCASRPGAAFTNRLSRSLQAEFLNFGFSGNGVNDAETAQIVAQVEDPALIIMDSEANSISKELVNERVPVFLDILRSRHPETPILVMTKVTYGPRYASIPILKEEFKNIVLQRQQAGDKHLYFFDGSVFWEGETAGEHTVDGAHPSDSGFDLIARKLSPVLKELLQKYGHL